MNNDRSENILEVSGLTVSYKFHTREGDRDIYKDTEVLHGINLSVRRGEIVALLGANGAGKTTLMHTIMALNIKIGHLWGELDVKAGKIIFNGHVINGLSTAKIVKLGLTLVPEGKLLFPSLTVLDNLEVGTYAIRDTLDRKTRESNLANVFRIFPALETKRKEVVRRLSGGEAQMVALGRGFMSQPKALLLDEPCFGLSPLLVKELMNSLSKFRSEFGITIFISEQNALAALSIADRAYVLKEGEVMIEGSAKELRTTEQIRMAYLGQ